MALHFKTGNLVDALLGGEVDYITHCCNAQGVMGSGIAKEIRERIPEAYVEYMFNYNMSKRFSGPNDFLGEVNCGGNVLNIIGQEYYGMDKKRYVNYGALAAGFGKLAVCVEQLEDKYCDGVTIGIPYKMASDRAGGDWNIVLELIQYLVVPYFKDVFIYKLPK